MSRSEIGSAARAEVTVIKIAVEAISSRNIGLLLVPPQRQSALFPLVMKEGASLPLVGRVAVAKRRSGGGPSRHRENQTLVVISDTPPPGSSFAVAHDDPPSPQGGGRRKYPPWSYAIAPAARGRG